MSRCTQLVLVLSLAACEHATPSPDFPEAPAPTVAPASAPAPVEPVVTAEPPKPAVAPVQPKQVVRRPAPVTPAPAAVEVVPLKKQWKDCNPRSRVACRWQEDFDEREESRITKKPIAPITDASADKMVQP